MRSNDMKKEIKVNDEELKRRKKSMRALKTCMIVLDVIAIISVSYTHLTLPTILRV